LLRLAIWQLLVAVSDFVLDVSQAVSVLAPLFFLDRLPFL